MASTWDLSAPRIAAVAGAGGGTAGFQPRIVPDSVAKMNRDGPDAWPLVTTNPVPPLNTAPVGAPGTETTSETFVPLSATHHGVVGPAVNPQPLTRSWSIRSAGTNPSETRLWTLKTPTLP